MATGTRVETLNSKPVEPVDPTEQRQPEEPGPDLEPGNRVLTPVDYIVALRDELGKRFEADDKRYTDLGTAVVKLSERLDHLIMPNNVQGVPGADQPQGMNPLFDIIIKGLDALKGSGGGQGGDSLIFDLYKKAHENFDRNVLLPTFSNLARQDVRGATHVA